MQQLNILPITLGLSAPEGPKCLPYSINWSTLPAVYPFNFTINLQSQIQSGQFSRAQAVYVDNMTCPVNLTITSQETGQRIYIPAFSQGMYPILSAGGPIFVVNIAYSGTFTTNLTFFNTPQVPFQFLDTSFGANYPATVPANTIVFTSTGATEYPVFNNLTDFNLVLSNFMMTVNLTQANTPQDFVITFWDTSLYPNAGINLFRGVVSLSASQPTIVIPLVFNPPYISPYPSSSLAVSITVQPATGTNLIVSFSGTIGNVLIA